LSGYGYTTAQVELRKWTSVRPWLEAEDNAPESGPPPLDDDEDPARVEAESDMMREGTAAASVTASEPRPGYMNRADEILSGAAGNVPLKPWSMAALPDQKVDEEAESASYGSEKQKTEEHESWADMLERTKRSLHRDRDKSREKARRSVGLGAAATGAGSEGLEGDHDGEGPKSVRQDRAASSAEEHRRLPKSEREWSFVPRQKVRNDVLLLAQRTAKKAVSK